MAKKRMKRQDESRWDGQAPFPITQRPNNNWAYASGMVPENPNEFGSCPSEKSLGRFPHHTYGVAGLGAILEDGESGMDRHVDYIVPTGTNNKFMNGGTY